MRRSSLLTVCVFLMGCAQVLDLEERTFTGASGVSRECDEYCSEAASFCTKEQNAELFYTPDGCLGICESYPKGDPKSPVGNTRACRLDKIRKVAQIGEARNSCAPASPGGSAVDSADGSASCGSNCEGYCSLYDSVCADFGNTDCVNRCKALRDNGTFNATADFESGADTLQCRIAHLSAAAAGQLNGDEDTRKAHCKHSGIKSDVQCDVSDTSTVPYSCDDYCRLVTTACTENNAVFENNEQCLAVCQQLPIGTAAELQGNNIRCRRENGYLALLGAPQTSCSQAGPAPSLCGNGKCESYCLLAQKACGMRFGELFPGPNGLETCTAQCGDGPNKIPGTGPGEAFSVKSPAAQSGRSLQCRLLRIERVLGEKNTALCAEVFGGGSCSN